MTNGDLADTGNDWPTMTVAATADDIAIGDDCSVPNEVPTGTPFMLSASVSSSGLVSFQCPDGYDVVGVGSLRGVYPSTSISFSTVSNLVCSGVGGGSYGLEDGFLNGRFVTPDGDYWVRLSKYQVPYVSVDFSREWLYFKARRVLGVWSIVP